MDPLLREYWTRFLHDEWDRLNHRFLGGKLAPPTFCIDDRTTRLGAWDAEARTIHLSASHLENDTHLGVSETLRHEMAHQVVDELYRAEGAPAHGILFHRACRQLGIVGSQHLRGELPTEAQRVLDKVQKLTRLAGSSNPHEAQLANATANRLLLRYNLTLGAGGDCERGYQQLGEPVRTISSEIKVVASIITQFYFVKGIWRRTYQPATDRPVSVFEAVGRTHDLAIADYTFRYLLRELDDLWRDYAATLPTGARARARRSYRVGVAAGFREQLVAQREQSTEEGLVWVEDPAVRELYETRYPHRTNLARGRYRDDAAFAQGKADGLDLRVRGGVNADESATSRGRLLE